VSNALAFENRFLAMIDNNRQRHLRKATKSKHTIVEYARQTSEFVLQCNCHKTNHYIFAGYPVFYRALENSVPLGGEDAQRAQGKLTAKGCNTDDPDYQISWRDASGALNSVFIEFKKVGKNPDTSQAERHKFLFETVRIPTEIVHTDDEYWAVLAKYKIPNRGRGLF
jgi:hypothetical protein